MNYTEEKTIEYCENDVKLTYELYKCNKKRKNKIIFLGILWWLWQLTWGALMTYPGLLVTAFCIVVLRCEPHKNGFSYIVRIGKHWGGLEIGAVALCDRTSSLNYIRRHEFGHNMQQLIFGPFQIFIWIASAIRYWYRKIKNITNPPYDSIWFERTATDWGYAATQLIEQEVIK